MQTARCVLSFFQVLFRGWRATQWPRSLAPGLLMPIVTAAAIALKNGAPALMNFSVRPLRLNERGSLHLFLLSLICRNCRNRRKSLSGFLQFLQFLQSQKVSDSP